MKHLPEEIRLNATHNSLHLRYAHTQHDLPAEYLRVYSPSAEVRGHGGGQAKLQTGKRFVTIEDLEMTGNYALKITFSDGHDSGLYNWDYLYELGEKYTEYWQDYLNRLAAAGSNREFDEQTPKKQGGCGGGSCGCSH